MKRMHSIWAWCKPLILYSPITTCNQHFSKQWNRPTTYNHHFLKPNFINNLIKRKQPTWWKISVPTRLKNQEFPISNNLRYRQNFFLRQPQRSLAIPHCLFLFLDRLIEHCTLPLSLFVYSLQICFFHRIHSLHLHLQKIKNKKK